MELLITKYEYWFNTTFILFFKNYKGHLPFGVSIYGINGNL